MTSEPTTRIPEAPTPTNPRLAVIERLYRTFEAHDFDTLWTLYAPDCDYAVLGRFGLPKTVERYRQFMRTFGAAFPDIYHHIDDAVVDGDKVWTCLTMTGTHQGPLRGMEPTGKAVRYPIVCMYRVNDEGLITKADFVSDDHRMRAQLGYS